MRGTTTPLGVDVEVTNSNNAVVGQLMSDGFGVSFLPPNDGPFQVCIVKRSDIITHSCFPQVDFATGSPLRPLGVTITYSDDRVVCADVSNSDTYFVINRVAGWQSATSDQCVVRGNTGESSSNDAFGFIANLNIVLLLISLLVNFF